MREKSSVLDALIPREILYNRLELLAWTNYLYNGPELFISLYG